MRKRGVRRGVAQRGARTISWDAKRETVLVEHEPAVRSFCHTLLENDADAQDAAQDAMIRFLLFRGDVENPKAWLFSAARFSAAEIRRKRYRHPTEELTDAVGDPTEDAIERMVRVRTMEELLAMLRPADRDLLEQLYVRGVSIPELAASKNVTPGNMRIMAYRARKRAAQVFGNARELVGGMSLIPVAQQLSDICARARRKVMSWRAYITHGDSGAGAFYLLGNFGPTALPVAAILLLGVGPSTALTHAPSPNHVLLAGPSTASLIGPGQAGGVAALQQTPTAPPTVPARPPSGGQAEAISNILHPKPEPQQQDVSFYSFTPSPSFGRDRTVFAAGNQIIGCATVCPVLFASHDGAASWQFLKARGFGGGEILLPPTYPIDPVIFAVGAAGLQRSDDAGKTFVTVVPGVLHGTIQPNAGAGQAEITVASNPLLVYHEATGLITPGPALPAGATKVDDLSYLGDGVHLVVGWERVDMTSPFLTGGAVSVCGVAQCGPSTVSSMWPPTLVRSSPTEAVDHTVIVSIEDRLLVSRDGGSSFEDRPVPSGVFVSDMAMEPDYARNPVMIVATMDDQASAPLFQTVGGGAFSGLTLAGLGGSAAAPAVTILPNGRVLIALENAVTLGIRCSSDGGRSWQLGCS